MKAKDVKYVFEENPELKEIGTKTQYYKYLKTVFPESKVKEIVYHGADGEIREFKYNKNLKRGERDNVIFFSKDKKFAEYWAKTSSNPNVIHSLVNIKKQFDYNKLSQEERVELDNTIKKEKGDLAYLTKMDLRDLDWTVFNGKFITDKISEMGFDSWVEKEGIGYENLTIFNPKQIHILGSKKDIKGFRSFVSDNNSSIDLENRLVSGIFILSILTGLIFSMNSITGNVVGVSRGSFNFYWAALALVGILGIYVNNKKLSKLL